jgi:hypothetical protein
MRDIYELILCNLGCNKLLRLQSVSKEWNHIIRCLIYYKIRIAGTFKYIKNNTIFPIIKNNRKINVLSCKYRNREEEPILIFNIEM